MKRLVLALAVAALPAAAFSQGPPSQPNHPQLGAPTLTVNHIPSSPRRSRRSSCSRCPR